MKKKKESKDKIRVSVVSVYHPIILELEKFQEHLDDKKKTMLKADLRNWAGHINFILTQLLKDVSNFIYSNNQLTKMQEMMEDTQKRELIKERENSGYFS